MLHRYDSRSDYSILSKATQGKDAAARLVFTTMRVHDDFRFGPILSQKSKIERPEKSRES